MVAMWGRQVPFPGNADIVWHSRSTTRGVMETYVLPEGEEREEGAGDES